MLSVCMKNRRLADSREVYDPVRSQLSVGPSKGGGLRQGLTDPTLRAWREGGAVLQGTFSALQQAHQQTFLPPTSLSILDGVVIILVSGPEIRDIWGPQSSNHEFTPLGRLSAPRLPGD